MQIVGIDEVGRGCWAGPVVAGAVLLNKPIAGLADSKVLAKKRREQLAGEIYASAQAVGLGWVSAAELDKIGLTEAVRCAMQRVLDEMNAKSVGLAYDQIIVDGSYNFLHDNPKSVAIIKADGTIPAVSAASIVAKVARDRYMSELSESMKYGFDSHVGYGTALHLERLQLHGVSVHHRKSFKPIAALLQ